MSGYEDEDWEYPGPDGVRRAATTLDELRVPLPSGAIQPVQTLDEADHLSSRVQQYMEHMQLTNISDLSSLDTVLVMELMVYRWGIWLGQGYDYANSPIDEVLFQRELSSYSTELRQLKKMLGIDKPSRDRQMGEGSISHYWSNLLERAKAFGVMRNLQFDRALELINELMGMLTFHDNATEEERAEFHITEADLLDWIRTVLVPEYQVIDEHFRETEQRFWIREM